MTIETEFYRSRSDLLPTFSLVLVASLVGVNSVQRSQTHEGTAYYEKNALPAFAQYSYYETAVTIPDETEQAEALRRFALTLFSQTQDNPQPVVDMLNQHFWDLV